MTALHNSARRCGIRLLAGMLSGIGLAGPACGESLSFEAALSTALQQAPQLEAAVAQVEAARLAAIPAGALPDPRLALGLNNVPIEGGNRLNLHSEPMTMQTVGVMQAFPNPAKRAARTRAAEGEVAVRRAQLRVDRLVVLSETASAWIARDAVERQLARIDALEAENRLFAAAVQARIAGGRGRAVDVIAPRQEAALIQSRRDELLMRRAQAVAALQRWVGARAREPLRGRAPEWTVDSASLIHGLHSHPELAIFDPRTRVVDAEVAAARANAMPDWALEVAYQKRGAQFGDMASVQVSVDLPLFRQTRQDPLIASKRAERDALLAQRDAALREHGAMIEAEVAAYQRLASAVRRQRTVLLPLASEKVDLALAGWRGGQGELVDLVASRRERIDAELMAVALEGERDALAAKLHFAYGNDPRIDTVTGE